MPKKTKYTNWRVEVGVEEPWIGEADDSIMNRRAEELKSQIIRHCDGLNYAVATCDTEFVCEFCGAGWSEDDDTCNGGCCSKDEELMEEIQEE